MVLLHFDVLENTVHLLDEVSAEDGFAVPELLVFAQQHVMHIVRDLRNQGHCLL